MAIQLKNMILVIVWDPLRCGDNRADIDAHGECSIQMGDYMVRLKDFYRIRNE